MDRERMGVKAVSGCDGAAGLAIGDQASAPTTVAVAGPARRETALLVEVLRDADGDLALAEEQGAF